MTRVSSAEGSDGNIGRDITQQIIRQPKALLITAGILFLFAVVPGMPSAVFLPLSILIAIVGLVMLTGGVKLGAPGVKADGKGLVVPAMTASGNKKPQEPESGSDTFYPTVPLVMDVARGLEPVFNPELLNEKLLEIRKGLYYDLGVPFPGIPLRYNDTLPNETYLLQLHAVPVTQGRLRPAHLLIRESEQNLQTLGIPYELDKAFLPHTPTIWVGMESRQTLDAAGLSYLEPLQILANHVAVVLKRYASKFLGIQEARFVMNRVDQQYPELIKELQRILAPQKVSEVLQRLVSEGVSIRNLRAIAEALIDWGQKEKDSVLLTEHVRTALRRQISYQYSAGQNALPAHILSPDLEETVRGAIRQTSAGSYLALEPSTARRIVEAVKQAVGDLSLTTQIPVLLTSMDIRRYMRKLIEQDLFEVAVVSYQKVTQEINIQPISRIELAL